MSRKNFEKILHDKLYDLPTDQQVPSWHEMQRRMTLAENEAGLPSRRRRWMPYAAAAALVAIMLGGGWYYYQSSSPNLQADHLLPGDTLDMTLPGIEEAIPIESLRVASNEVNSTLGNLFQSAAQVKVLNTPHQNPLHLTQNQPTLVEDFDIKLAAESLLADELTVEQFHFAEPQEPPKRNNTVRAHDSRSTVGGFGGFDWNIVSENQVRKNWQVSAYTSTFASADNSVNSGRFDTPDMLISSMIDADYMTNVSKRLSGMQYNHHFPISVGLGVKKYLNDRWALETGLVYTYLESSGEMEAAGFQYKARQQVHYLGVPLYASYSLFNNNRWDVYLTGGFMAEVGLSAQQRIRMYIDEDAQSTSYENLNPKGVLWSTTLGGGVTYYMVDRFGVYLEPGASYYFSNDRQPVTYRTENPWSFNVRLGFRVKF